MKRFNSFTSKDLTFVVCAYKECVYLDEAIRSLINQNQKSNIIISTSTPNKLITKVANKYGIKIFVNKDPGQIKDYNFAMSLPKTKLIMLMHQDEVLLPDFTKEIIEALNFSKDPIIAFTDYKEMHNDTVDKKDSSLVKIKRIMLTPNVIKRFLSSKFAKRLILRFGDPITHPTVVCVRNKMPDVVFREEFKASMDWDLWERLSNVTGSFVYVNKVLLHHRMNDDNQTAKLLRETDARYNDQLKIFQRFWPSWIAKILMRFYSKSDRYY